jgi:F0F1-type ATP synthase assembly protein I
MNKKLQEQEKKLDLEVEHMEEIEYGLKELVHGILIGVVIGFILAWMIL